MKLPNYVLWKTWAGDNDLIFVFCELSLLEFNSWKIGQIERDGERAKKFEAARIHFLIDVFAAVAILDAKAPY